MSILLDADEAATFVEGGYRCTAAHEGVEDQPLWEDAFDQLAHEVSRFGGGFALSVRISDSAKLDARLWFARLKNKADHLNSSMSAAHELRATLEFRGRCK